MVPTRMSGITRFARQLARGAGLATGRFPVAALAILTVSVLANVSLAGINLLPEEQMIRLLLALHAAAAVAVGTRLFAEARAMRRGVQMLLPLTAAAAAGLVITAAGQLWLLAPPVLTALTLGIPLAPYLGRPDDAKFWTFTLWTVVGVTLAFLSVLLFVLGVSAILEMVRYLFEIGLSSDAYGHIYATALTLVGPLFALGRIPTDFEETTSATDDRLAQGVRFLFDWVATPLALVTAVVPHLYAAKILLGAVPKNEIGWIVSFYALLVLSIRVVVDPFAETGGPSTRLFGRVWALMLVVPLGLLTYAAGVRIAAEGITLERYYLSLATLAAVLIVALQAVPRLRGDIRLMCGLPLLLLALSAAGPWGAGATVGRSQARLIAASLLGPGATEPLGPSQSEALRTRLYALGEVGEIPRILPLLSEPLRTEMAAVESEAPDTLQQVLMTRLGIGYGQVTAGSTDEPVQRNFSAIRPAAFALDGFDTALPEQTIYPVVGQAPGLTPDPLLATLDGGNLVLSTPRENDRFSLAPALVAMDGDRSPSPAAELAPVIADLTSETGRKIRARISYATLDASTGLPTQMTLTLLLRRADWPSLRRD